MCWSDSVTALLSNDKRLVSGERDEDPPTKCRYISWLFPIDEMLDLLMPPYIDRSLRDDHDIYICNGLIQTNDSAEVFSRGTYSELTDNLSNPYISQSSQQITNNDDDTNKSSRARPDAVLWMTAQTKKVKGKGYFGLCWPSCRMGFMVDPQTTQFYERLCLAVRFSGLSLPLLKFGCLVTVEVWMSGRSWKPPSWP